MTHDPRPGGRARWLWSGTGLALFVLVYVLVVFFYGNSTRLDISQAGVGLSTDPRAVDVVHFPFTARDNQGRIGITDRIRIGFGFRRDDEGGGEGEEN